MPALLSSLGLSAVGARLIAASVLGALLIVFAFAYAPFRRSPGQIGAGIAVGLLVAAGWCTTGLFGADDFNPVPVTSLTFIAPIADALQYVMLSTGSTLNFGIVTVFGVFAGSLVTALLTGRFHLEGYSSPRHMLRSAGGAALMGTGGVMAFGCSIGQGLTGFRRWRWHRSSRSPASCSAPPQACAARCGCGRWRRPEHLASSLRKQGPIPRCALD